MTRARDIANLVDSNGDIVAGALDNVPASNDASALTTGTLDGARLPSTLPAIDGSALTGIATDLVDDTTPQLGGALDLNSSNITGTGNINTTGTATFSGLVTANNASLTAEGGSATVNVRQGLAKAWVNFNGSGTIAARDSFNHSSLTDSGTGNYKTTHANNFSSANYTFACQGGNPSDDGTRLPSRMRDNPTTSTYGNQQFTTTAAANQDATQVAFTFFGDLA